MAYRGHQGPHRCSEILLHFAVAFVNVLRQAFIAAKLVGKSFSYSQYAKSESISDGDALFRSWKSFSKSSVEKYRIENASAMLCIATSSVTTIPSSTRAAHRTLTSIGETVLSLSTAYYRMYEYVSFAAFALCPINSQRFAALSSRCSFCEAHQNFVFKRELR